MEFRDGPEDDDEPVGPLLPPDDRLWRHPSEVAADPRPEPFRRRRVPEPRLLTIAALSGLIGALLSTGLAAAVGGYSRVVITQTPVERVQEFAPVSTSAGGTTQPDIVSIAKNVRPSIVQILDSAGSSIGSGVIFRTDGLVLTNQHVVEESAAITLVLADGREVPADVVAGDVDTDIAVVRITPPPPSEGYPSALLGTATRLQAGEMAVAVGSPLGLSGGPSITAGVVSALGREVQTGGVTLYDMIQFDAPIAPGSSGGALVDANGAVIGITSAIGLSEVGAEGLGFATPIDIARMVAEQLVETGRAVHVWLGIEGEDLDSASADRLDVSGGAVVRGVRGGSPAELAGIRAADIIVAVNGTTVRTMGALVVALRTHRPGDVVTLRVSRDGKGRDVKAILREAPRR